MCVQMRVYDNVCMSGYECGQVGVSAFGARGCVSCKHDSGESWVSFSIRNDPGQVTHLNPTSPP